MFSANELKAQIARKGYTQKQLAKEMGIAEKTLWYKIKTGKFGTDDVSAIMEILDIKDPVPIFFAQE